MHNKTVGQGGCRRIKVWVAAGEEDMYVI